MNSNYLSLVVALTVENMLFPIELLICGIICHRVLLHVGCSTVYIFKHEIDSFLDQNSVFCMYHYHVFCWVKVSSNVYLQMMWIIALCTLVT
jgi:hypothetical protein